MDIRSGNHRLIDRFQKGFGRALAPKTLSPRRHRPIFSHKHPGPPAPSVRQRVELGAADRDRATVGQRDDPARGIDGRDQLALRSKVRFDKTFDPAHARTNALGAAKVKQKPRMQSE
jgi:hypothetical protein